MKVIQTYQIISNLRGYDTKEGKNTINTRKSCTRIKRIQARGDMSKRKWKFEDEKEALDLSHQLQWCQKGFLTEQEFIDRTSILFEEVDMMSSSIDKHHMFGAIFGLLTTNRHFTLALCLIKNELQLASKILKRNHNLHILMKLHTFNTLISTRILS